MSESFSQYPVPDGEVSAPEAAGTLSASDRLNSEIIGQSVEATERSIPAEDALRLVIDTTPALIHTGRPDGYLDYFNRSWREYTGKSLGELCGWRWTDAVHPEDVAGIIQKWQISLESGEPFEAEARVRRGDGSYRAFLHRKAPLRDEHGRSSNGLDRVSTSRTASMPKTRRHSKHSCKPLSM